MHKVFILGGLAILHLTGCAAGDLYKTVNQSNQQAIKQIEHLSNDDRTVVKLVNEPSYPIETRVLPVELPDWQKQPYQVRSAGMPLHLIAEDITRASGLYTQFGPMVNQSLPVKLTMEKGTVSDALAALSAVTGLSYTIFDETVLWTKYVSKRFDLSHFGGQYSYQLGSNNAGSDSHSQLGANHHQYENIELENSDIYAELNTSLARIVGDDGFVDLSPGTSSALVTTNKVKMLLVTKFMREFNNAVSNQVILEIKVLRFKNNNSAMAGIDWSLVRKSVGSTLKLGGSLSSGLNSTFSNAAPTTIELIKNSNNMNTSNVLINALEEQGSVGVITEPRLQTLINRVARLEISERQNYIKKTAITTDDNGNRTVELEPGSVQNGYSIYLLANTDSSSRIYLHISSHLSDLLSLDRTTVGDSIIESPIVHENTFSQSVVLTAGQTMLLNSLKQASNTNTASAISDLDNTPLMQAGAQTIEQIIVLITPNLIMDGL